ncbi:MAG: hypothetical protein ACYS80_26335 [Planctomycetota bacterium]|jgi:membrane-bound metal-dependent hydrolase YbcI (DUF457 family)
MPFTPYHFGPAGFIGLVFRKWIDVPVFVLANVIVDVEVLIVLGFGFGWPIHRYSHTLLVGAAVGVLWGMAAYPLRRLFKKIMRILHIPYKPRLWKMVISGILGVWLHVLIDGAYHFDVKMFWPNKTISLWRMIQRDIGKERIEAICIAFLIAAIIPYAIAVASYIKQNKIKK